MTAIFSTSGNNSYSEYAKYAIILHDQLLKRRWRFYKESILANSVEGTAERSSNRKMVCSNVGDTFEFTREKGKLISSMFDEFLTKNLTKEKTTSLVIADLGTSDGGNVIPFLKHIIDFLKSKDYSGELTLIFNDLPGFDYNVLSKKVRALKDEGMTVHILMNPCDMFERCLPKDFLDLGTSTYAILNLTKGRIENGIGWHTATETERQWMKDQAASDWRHFLTQRYEEMKIGGYLVIRSVKQCPAYTKALEYTFIDIYKLGLITKEELRNINFMQYERSEDEIRAPFEDTTFSLQLKLVDVNHSEISGDIGYEEIILPYLTWLTQLLMSGLSTERDHQDKEKAVNEYRRIFEDRCRQIHSNTICVLEAVIQKEK